MYNYVMILLLSGAFITKHSCFWVYNIMTVIKCDMNTYLNRWSHDTELDQAIFHSTDSSMVFFIFIQILIEDSVGKQWRPWSDAAFCRVWAGSALFTYVPLKGR